MTKVTMIFALVTLTLGLGACATKCDCGKEDRKTASADWDASYKPLRSDVK